LTTEIGLGCASSDHPSAGSVESLGQEKFQFPGFITAKSQTGAIIPFHPKFRP
jgi:hypothetical protein